MIVVVIALSVVSILLFKNNIQHCLLTTQDVTDMGDRF